MRDAFGGESGDFGPRFRFGMARGLDLPNKFGFASFPASRSDLIIRFFGEIAICLVGVCVRAKTFLIVILALPFFFPPAVSSAQSPRFPPMPQPETPPEDPAKSKLERDMAKKANQERHAALRRDTEKLLKLSTELKDYVDKTNENVLSFEVVKKAEEIEKLAHSVKEKMKAN